MVSLSADLVRLRGQAVDAHKSGKKDQARLLYGQYLGQVPGDAAMWSNLGILLRTEGKHAMALVLQERAYALDPMAPGVRNNLANIYSDLGRYQDSLNLRYALNAESPDDSQQKAMIGRCLRGMGRYIEAADWLRVAISQHPAEAELKVQLGFALLGAGQYAEAFDHYRARWQTDELVPRKISKPEWNGTDDVAGKTVLVLTEQGFGDSVLFARFLPMLKARGAKVVFGAEKPMLRLFQGLEGADLVSNAIGDLNYDYWVNIMDLPLLGLTGFDDIPPPSRLTIPLDSVERAKAITAPHRDKFKVGVVWTGSATYKGNSFRSFSHTDYLPLTTLPDVQLFSLYKGPYLDAFMSDGYSGLFVDTASTDRDFADCAATMQEMDLIITSDTATAHIAGSLGLPTWVVLHWDPFWVFRHSGETTPWYPSMRLFRQKKPMDWTEVHAEVRAALVEVLEKRND